MAFRIPNDSKYHEAIGYQHAGPEPPLPSTADDCYLRPGLEVASPHVDDKFYVNNGDHSDKQVLIQDDKEVLHDQKSYEPFVQSTSPDHDSHEPARRRQICGIKRAVFWAILAAVLLACALAVGLGVGLTTHKSDEASSTPTLPDTTSSPTQEMPAAPTDSDIFKIGGSIEPSYYTDNGAWNGSGISYIWQNFTQDWDDILTTNEYSHVVYFQHHSGSIQWMRQTSDYSWKEGSQDLLVVATDARNSTPISAVQYTANHTNYWNVFYIDSDNMIRQRSGNNGTVGWKEGSISDAKLSACDGGLVGLSACVSAINESVPIRLFYASNSTAFEEYLWWADTDEWVWQNTWEGYSAAADVGCFQGSGEYRYVGLVNPSNALEIWYQPAQEIGAAWQKTQNEISNVHSASSLSLTLDYAFYQANDTNAITVATMEWQDFYTNSGNDDISPSAGLAGVAGTHMSAMQVGDYTWIFYQRTGSDVTWLERAPKGDKWKVATPIPFSE